MLYSIKNIEDLQILASLQNQIQEVILQNKLGEQNYHEDAEKIFEPMTDAIKNTSQDITKTKTETYI